MRHTFDVKDRNLIVWNGEVVMSRSEEPFLCALFERLADLRVSSVLEVGFGLGISAQLIQQTFRPKHHDIVELDQTIFRDLQAFSRRHKSVRSILGPFSSFKTRRKYDFIFYDIFDYSTEHDEGDDVPAWAKRICYLLKPSGIVCVPDFNVDLTPQTRIRGMKRVRREVIEVPPYLLEDGNHTSKGIFECWQPTLSAKSK